APLRLGLLDGVTLGLALLDDGARIRVANRAAGRLFGCAAGDLVGRVLADLFPPEGREAAERLLAAARAEGRAEDDSWHLRADGLDVARIITGKLRLRVETVDAVEVARAAVETVRHNAETRKVELVMSVDGQPASVAGDPARLQQVIANLLTNAVKFTPEGGR